LIGHSFHRYARLTYTFCRPDERPQPSGGVNEETPYSAIGNKVSIELVNRSAHSARPDRSCLEKAWHCGPKTVSRPHVALDQFEGATAQVIAEERAAGTQSSK
jgi:hypothetical protein